jgi:hypothetical protein
MFYNTSLLSLLLPTFIKEFAIRGTHKVLTLILTRHRNNQLSKTFKQYKDEK